MTLNKTGAKFTDNEFVPGPPSLIKDWNCKSKLVREIADEWKQLKWIRADQIPCFMTGDVNDKIVVFDAGADGNDIF